MNGFFAPIPGSSPDPEPEPRRRDEGGARHRDHPRRGPGQVWNLHLETAGTDIAAPLLTASPSVTALVVDDLCWQAAAEDWEHRRPAWWRTRARAAWRAEGAELAATADRLRAAAEGVLREL
ncbi:hypothetical protein [Catenulispora subtropica]|uniref:Uncharacterized protein n=1 Tax=Catenulispora subtropica TaxID=450798 RepID=A0ABN2TGM5_9ACTN